MNGYVRAYEGKEPFLFVSYAHKDSDLVLPVIRALHEKKYRVWYDEGIAPGSEWPENIALHLRDATAILAFVSENYLSSPNCKNEVQVAVGHKKIPLQVALDGAGKQPLFTDAILLDFTDDIADKLADGIIGSEFIGDGITGYQYSIEKKKSINKWNFLLGLTAALAIVFAISLYGLYTGWFDGLLPPAQEPPPSATPAPSIESIEVSNNLVGRTLPVAFPSGEEKSAVYELLGWPGPSEMKYVDLLGMEGVTHLEIGNGSITDLTFASYLPNLAAISLQSSKITDLTPLTECPNLKTVQVSADMLPLTIPDGRNFEIEVN